MFRSYALPVSFVLSPRGFLRATVRLIVTLSLSGDVYQEYNCVA